MSFHEPSRWLLVLLVLIPLAWWTWLRPRRRPTVLFSSVSALDGLGTSWRTRLRFILPLLRTFALGLLVLALARPQRGDEQTRVHSEGIAIQLIVDRSGSMQAMDFQVDGERVDRLSAVKKVVQEFVLGGEGLKGRADDLIGMVAFARFADSKCPLTLDHDYLIESISQTEIVTEREEDGTAIGDAIALGVERLRSLDQQQRLQGSGRIKSKIIILLTDGDNNAGDIEPLKAAEIAATLGIKVYTIGAGTKGMAPMPVMTPFGRQMQPMQVNIDEASLRKIAEKTKGQYFRATDTDSLRNIYAEIDKLEKSETVEKRYRQYREFATEPMNGGYGLKVPPLLLCVFVLLGVELVLANTVFRRIP